MRIAVGSDHAGFNLKNEVLAMLKEWGHEAKDFGAYSMESVDYPDVAREVGESVARGDFECGILVCSTGTGISIAANKVKGIRAALCHDTFSARRAREHNNANILCMGEYVIGKGVAQEVVKAYLSSDFEGGRHSRRVSKIMDIEQA